MATKRKVEVIFPAEESVQLLIRPLGAGQEVGRSCIILEFKGRKIMLDCGIHPGLEGMDALPYIDLIDPAEIDLLLISHFHLDHCGALPWFVQKTSFKGRTFMTHATKAIYRWLLSDYVKVSNISADDMLYTETDLEESMDKIETINFHEVKEVAGIKFWCYHAGHVLGAAMFMIEIAGVKLLYTGDFSRQEDRHLMAAEIPSVKPVILIIESTYGTHIHEKREEREARFCNTVHDIVNREGRCLIPVFALGRAQELLLILEVDIRGTLAKHIMSEPEEITTMSGQKLQLKMSVDYISFSAHTDYQKTSEVIRALKPPHVILVHGEQNEMARLKAALIREYEDNDQVHIEVHNPRNTEAVTLNFRGEKLAKVMGSLADEKCVQGQRVSGILHTQSWLSTMKQTQAIPFTGPYSLLVCHLRNLTGEVEELDGTEKHTLKIFKNITLIHEAGMVLLEWLANPLNDMYADAVTTVVLEVQSNPKAQKAMETQSAILDMEVFQNRLGVMLQDMFGLDCVDFSDGKNVSLTVDGKTVHICLETRSVCYEDESTEDDSLRGMVELSVQRLYGALNPVI
ncbi:Cleavage and polyadenylation specificity factor subunit 3 [Dissostichus eleginoides]|uniref:Cleavage and polyadenylation specificity factor subunit 3 n=1 Tax=Dissostichus eleginoides TaxID=100907 RepID=A0AAD9C4E7_DISEL|nr:Cleavage and polyadenylation specificity factor subunit 3 [Dissostichus eleginoides]